jgi:hypothetical protein
MDRNQKINTGLWLAAFAIGGGAAALSYAGYFTAEKGFSEIHYRAILVILGTVLGLIGFYFTWQREDWVKGLTFLGMLAVLVGGGQLFAPPSGPHPENYSASGLVNASPENRLLTCPVCGYKTLSEENKLCPICYVELSDTERIVWDYPTMEKMIEEEQAMFFAAEGFRDNDFFYHPEYWELDGITFEKDTNWQPRIDAVRVRKLRDTLIEVGVIDVIE